MPKSKTRWPLLVMLAGCLVLIALVGQAVSAQPLQHELKPPFHFVERPAAPAALMLPPGSTLLMTETFGASFNPVTTLSGSTPQWRTIVNPGDTAGYYWGKGGPGTPITSTNTAWSAATPISTAAQLIPGISPYPAGQDAWLIYGPIDLGKFTYGHLSFEYYLDSLNGDALSWGYSTDGQNFYGNTQSGPLHTWLTDTLSFPTDSASRSVYIAFAFNSQANPQGSNLGAFVRNVRFTAQPVQYNYLPLVLNNYPVTPTPTPTSTPTPPLYGYTFNQGSTDINAWGGPYYSTSTTKYGQCVTSQCTMHTTYPHGNPANSLRLFTNGTYQMVASSPNNIAPANYDLYVDISPWQIYPRYGGCAPWCDPNDIGTWYGIIFNASADTFGANPSQFAYNKQYYRLFFYPIDATRPIAIRLDRCDGHADPTKNNCSTLKVNTSLPSNFIGNAGGFDTIHIQRLASGSIQVWLNDVSVLTVTDATYTGASFGKFGAFLFASAYNATQNPPTGYEIQVDYDNIKLYNR
jgi:hypothetical protein